jgi:hypothetical protein
MQPLGCAQRYVARDAAAHGQADEMELACLEVLGDAQDVAGKILELQRAVVVLGIAVAARVAGRGLEAAREELDLATPVTPIAADPVQEKHQLAVAGDGHREPRRRFDENRVQGSLRLCSRDSDGAAAGLAVLL